LKLLFTQDALVNAGAERSHLEILSRFSEQTEVSLAYFYPKHELKKEYEKAGIRLIFLDIPESYHFPLAVSRLVKLIKAEKPDLLVSCLWRADQITRIASWITDVPLVGTLVNDSYSPLAWKDKKGLKYKIVHWLDRWTASIPIHWIANAQALADSHVKTLGLDASKISVVYRGRSIPSVLASAAMQSVDHSAKLETDCFVVPPRNDAGVSSSEFAFRFLSYGRLLERKGFQDAICAFAIVVRKYPHCTLTIYGEGSYRTQLEALIHDLNLREQVILPGKASNPTVLLITADCFLFPSWYEGFSGALVEAMMAGIPIIASDIPMNLEAVDSEESALIFKVKSIDSLSEKMALAIENPKFMNELGASARLKAVKLFSINEIAFKYEEKLLEIYNQLS
jgi:glycosyltransferase involved in cell wall biosynthesis